MKTIETKEGGGRRFELRSNGSWMSIIITHQNGQSIQNEWGGYPTLHVGSEKYVMRRWRAI